MIPKTNVFSTGINVTIKRKVIRIGICFVRLGSFRLLVGDDDGHVTVVVQGFAYHTDQLDRYVELIASCCDKYRQAGYRVALFTRMTDQ